MLSKRWLILAACYSFTAMAAVRFEEKEARVASIMRLQSQMAPLDLSAYQRELSYEKSGFTLSQRTQNETNLLAEQMRLQIQKAYEAALKELGDHQLAYEKVRDSINEDLEHADPEIKLELKAFALDTLDQVQKGNISEEVKLENVSKMMRKGVKERSLFLNFTDPKEKKEDKTKKAKEEEDHNTIVLGADPIFPSRNTSKDSDKKEFKNKEELLESLMSDRESTRWVSKSNQNLRVGEMSKVESKIAVQVKVSFLGASFNAGPFIEFKREYTTTAIISAEGMYPVIQEDGNFDNVRRDKDGKAITTKDGNSYERRFISLTCEAELNFRTERGLEGSISAGVPVPIFAGVGVEGTASGSVSNEYTNNVNIASRRIALPHYVNNQSVTVKFITEFCHNDFLNASFSNNLTVEKSLDVLMKNLISTLTYSNSQTKCVTDEHCDDWYARNLWRSRTNIAKCVQQGKNREGAMECHLRGLKGENCAVFDKSGKRISDGMFEVQCDTGLKCVQVQEGGWFKGWDLYRHAKGQCKPAKR